MGATSVTGVGLGSADKKQKGSEHLRVGAEKIIGPRIVYAGSVTLDGSGNGSVVIPAPAGVATNYSVFVTDGNATAAAATAGAVAFASGNATITVKGPASEAVFVMLVKKGLAI